LKRFLNNLWLLDKKRSGFLSKMVDELYNRQREWFLSFLRNTTQKKETIEQIVNQLPLCAEEIYRTVRRGHRIDLLDIGTGTGDAFTPLIGRIFPGVWQDYAIHEPSLGMLALFLKNFDLSGGNFFATSLYDNKGHESFTCQEPSKYEFVSASHVFYYVPDWEHSLKAIHESLVPGGVAVISLNSEDGALYKFRKNFFPKLEVKELNRDSPHSGEELIDTLNKIGISNAAQDVVSYTDVTDYLNGKEDGKKLISFFLRKDYDDIPESIQRQIFNYIRNNSVISGRRRFLEFRDKLVWVKKEGGYAAKIREPRPTDLDYYEVRIGDVKKFLKNLIEKELDNTLQGTDFWIKDAYFTLLVANSFLSDVYYRNFIYRKENNPFGLGINPWIGDVFGYCIRGDEHYSLVTCRGEELTFGPSDPDCVVLIGPEADTRTKYEHIKRRTRTPIRELTAIVYLDDLVDVLFSRLPQESKEAFGDSNQFKDWLIEKNKEHGHFTVFNFGERSVFSLWAQDAAGIRSKLSSEQKTGVRWKKLEDWGREFVSYPKYRLNIIRELYRERRIKKDALFNEFYQRVSREHQSSS
jgi:SAM-dependent methyltransferase